MNLNLINNITLYFFAGDVINNFKIWDSKNILNPSIYDINDKNIDLLNIINKNNTYEVTFDKEYYKVNDAVKVEYNDMLLLLTKSLSILRFETIICRQEESKLEGIVFPVRTRYRSNYAPDTSDILFDAYKKYRDMSISDRNTFLITLSESIKE